MLSGSILLLPAAILQSDYPDRTYARGLFYVALAITGSKESVKMRPSRVAAKFLTKLSPGYTLPLAPQPCRRRRTDVPRAVICSEHQSSCEMAI